MEASGWAVGESASQIRLPPVARPPHGPHNPKSRRRCRSGSLVYEFRFHPICANAVFGFSGLLKIDLYAIVFIAVIIIDCNMMCYNEKFMT